MSRDRIVRIVVSLGPEPFELPNFVGMTVGEKATVKVAAADAYGPRQADAIHAVERDVTVIPVVAFGASEKGGQIPRGIRFCQTLYSPITAEILRPAAIPADILHN